jgi:hypothetical protein
MHRSKKYFSHIFISFVNVKHAPLVARAELTHGFEVIVTVNDINRTATSGCVARLFSYWILSENFADWMMGSVGVNVDKIVFGATEFFEAKGVDLGRSTPAKTCEDLQSNLSIHDFCRGTMEANCRILSPLTTGKIHFHFIVV